MATVAKFTWTGVGQANNFVVNGAAQGSASVNPPKWIGVGKGGATAATVNDTALNTELTSTDTTPGAYARAVGTLSLITTTQPNDTLQNTGTWTDPSNATAGSTVSEVGLFDQLAAGGNMWFRATFTGLALSPGMGFVPTCQMFGTTS